LSANSVMRGRLDARRTLKSLVADLRFNRNDYFYGLNEYSTANLKQVRHWKQANRKNTHSCKNC
ncbi:hypothetical protein GAN23_21280, partial [Bacteroides thetaiotaomicron]